MPQYRKKPVIVEAIQWTGDAVSTIKIEQFIGKELSLTGGRINGDARLHIPTLEGVMEASENDYIIRGIKGEFYPCKQDIFEATYDLVH